MSKLTVIERARLYVAKIPPAVSGSGGHNATFTVACSLVKGFGLAIDEARAILAEWNAGCSPPWSAEELEHKLKQADGVNDEKPRGWLRDEDGGRDDGPRAPTLPSRAANVPLPVEPPAKPEFEENKLKSFAARWRPFVDTAWLADRSPVLPAWMTPDGFLRAVFREGEKVIIFTNQKSQGQAVWPLQAMPETGDLGVWYLDQPVDGCEHANPRARAYEDGAARMSRRSEESVTDWRHLVLESDEANARDWMAALVQIPLRLVAIYTSGARSIHALVRVDAPTKQEWDNTVRQIRPVFVTLGADPKAMTAVRLTRLPGCWREGKMVKTVNAAGKKVSEYVRFPRPVLQKLLYLNPEPEMKPLIVMPRVRQVLAHWSEWLPQVLASSPADVFEQEMWPMVEECERTLAWFAQSITARTMLSKLREWRGA